MLLKYIYNVGGCLLWDSKSDIEIAQEAKPQDIREIAKKLGLTEDDLELYGKYKAKVDYNLLKKIMVKKKLN